MTKFRTCTTPLQASTLSTRLRTRNPTAANVGSTCDHNGYRDHAPCWRPIREGNHSRGGDQPELHETCEQSDSYSRRKDRPRWRRGQQELTESSALAKKDHVNRAKDTYLHQAHGDNARHKEVDVPRMATERVYPGVEKEAEQEHEQNLSNLQPRIQCRDMQLDANAAPDGLSLLRKTMPENFYGALISPP